MIGMAFGSFLTLLVVGFIAALILHYGFQYRMLPGFDGFLGKWAVGWVAAWLSSPVLGHWGFQVSGEYVIPAMVGALAGAFLATASLKAMKTAASPAPPKTMPMETRMAAD